MCVSRPFRIYFPSHVDLVDSCGVVDFVNQYLLGLNLWVFARLLLPAQWFTQVVYRVKAVSDTLHTLFLLIPM